jgi:hypothetical protein
MNTIIISKIKFIKHFLIKVLLTILSQLVFLIEIFKLQKSIFCDIRQIDDLESLEKQEFFICNFLQLHIS